MIEHFCPKATDADAGRGKGNEKTCAAEVQKDLFESDEGEESDTTSSSKSTRMPEESSGGSYFYNDPQTMTELKQIIGEDGVKETKWFFEDMRLDRSKRTYYKRVDANNNKWVIDSFCKSPRIRDIIMNKIICRRFYEIYGIRQNSVNKTPEESSGGFYFYNNTRTTTELKHIIGEDGVEETKWFFKEMRLAPSERKHYGKVDANNNKWVIDSFCKSPRIRDIIMNKIIRWRFYEIYGIRQNLNKE